MSVVLCVRLWPKPDREEELAAYEDAVLALLSEHGGRLVARARASESGDGPLETQLIEFDDEAGMTAYLADPRRAARTAERDAAIARTEIQGVTLV